MNAPITSIESTASWIKYTKKLCDSCVGSCCSLPVEVKSPDLIRMGVMDEFELDENPKKIAKRLKKEGVIEHFYAKKGLFTLSRMASGDCVYLDQSSRRCTIYQDRPDTCRNHPKVGPRPGFCAYNEK